MVTSFDSRSKREREPPFPYGQFSGVCVCLMWKSMRSSSSVGHAMRPERDATQGTRAYDRHVNPASELRVALEHARARTEELLEPLTNDELTTQFSPLQSPLVWDLAHVGHFEELWLLRNGDASSTVHDDVYDALAHARPERG